MHIKKETFSAFYSPCFGTNPNIWIPESKRQNARRHMCNFMLVNPLVPRGKARWCFLPQRNLQEGLSEISRDRIMDIMRTMLTGVRVGSSTGVVTRDLLHGSFLTKAPRSLALHDQTVECGPVLRVLSGNQECPGQPLFRTAISLGRPKEYWLGSFVLFCFHHEDWVGMRICFGCIDSSSGLSISRGSSAGMLGPHGGLEQPSVDL